MFESVKLPNGEDLKEWIAIHTIDFYNKINMLFSDVFETCTPKSCPLMTAGSTTYLFRNGKKYKKPTEVPASEYCEMSLDWIEEALNNESLFPTNFSLLTPDGEKDFRHTIKEITKRIFRLYAHIFYSHYDTVKQLGEAQILFGFKMFLAFALEFSLLKEKELEVMREWIETNLNIDIHKHIKKKKKKEENSSNVENLDTSQRSRSKSRAVSPMEDSNTTSLGSSKISNQTAFDLSKSSQLFSSTFTIEIVEAKNLAGKDLSGTSDPYVVIDFEGNSSKTSVVWKQNSPKWNERFSFVVNDDKSVIGLTVMDENLLRKDAMIGKCELFLQSFLDEEEHETWFTLSHPQNVNCQGAIHVILKYTSRESSATKVISKLCDATYYQPLLNYFLHLTPELLIGLIDFTSISMDDSLFTCFLQIYCYSHDESNFAHQLLCYLIRQQVSNCQQVTTLFRSNSLASKFLASYFRIYGQEYLRKILYSLITQICVASEDTEIDPNKSENADAHMTLLLNYCTKIVEAIMHSMNQFPISLRSVLREVYETVMQKFDNETVALQSIGNLFFLRFVNPAILSPTSHLLYKGIASAQSLKTLVRVTKILQTLANGNTFGNKEQFMLSANVFLEQYSTSMKQFLSDLALRGHSQSLSNLKQALPTESVASLVQRFSKSAEQRLLYSLFSVHSHFVTNLERMKQELVEWKEESTTMIYEQRQEKKKELEEAVMNLEIVVKQVGPVPSIQKQNRSKVSKSVFKSRKAPE